MRDEAEHLGHSIGGGAAKPVIGKQTPWCREGHLPGRRVFEQLIPLRQIRVALATQLVI